MINEEERKGTAPEKLLEIIGGGRSLSACVEGDCVEGSAYCGQIGGAIKSIDRKSTRLNSSHVALSRMPYSA